MELDIKGKERVYEGFFKIDKLKVDLPNGATIGRELIYKNDSAVIIAISEKGEVFLTKQPRVGCGKLESIEIPAGLIEKGEEPIKAAMRELKEETGCVADKWTELGNYYPDPACCTSKSYLYLAENAKKVSELNLDPDEFIEPFSLKFEELEKFVEDGIVNDINTVLAIYKVRKLFKDREE